MKSLKISSRNMAEYKIISELVLNCYNTPEHLLDTWYPDISNWLTA
jgi:hypothetical protein